MASTDIFVVLIITLPLAGFLLNGIMGLSSRSFREKKGFIGLVSNLAVFIPFGLSLLLFFNMTSGSEPVFVHLFNWISVGSFGVDIAYQVDQLSILMTMVVTGVGAFIHMYSIGYMKHDPGFWKFFAYLNLFIFAMLNLVLADNLLLLFLGWEGVGLCSYLLIGFWYEEMANSSAAKKAFIYNRIGDFAFLIGLFLIFKYTGTLNITEVLQSLEAMPHEVKVAVGLLFFVGATGKSAQIPLFVWLPDAMAGPTPVSALIHAATMVTSGIYLISRMSAFYVQVPEVMIVIAAVGALTAIMAATIALTQYDIKRVLAYSTVSQLGYMFLALGAGGFTAAMFHVVTHAFFKACLFLGSGSVIHTMEHAEHELHEEGKDVHFDPQDMRYMGGLRKYMPSTYKTFMISTLAIAGIPPLAGFFSKDEILVMAFNSGLGEHAGALYMALWVIGMVTALLTALYMFRLTLRTFHGSFKLPQVFDEAKGSEQYLHESPSSMTIPLWVLAVAALVGGFIGVPNFIASTFTHEAAHINLLHDWLHTVTAGHKIVLSHATEWLLMAISIGVAVGGMILGYKLFNKDRGEASDESLAERFGVMYEIWSEKYNLDEIYEGYISRPLVRFSDRVLATFDMKVLDGTVNAVGGITRLFGSLFRYLQTGVTSNYALALVVGVIIVLSLLMI